jgi:hypothetical protein
MLRPAPARLLFALLPIPITTQAQYEADAISGFLMVTDDGPDVATALRRFKERVFGLSVEFNFFLYQATAETTGALRSGIRRGYTHTGSDRGVRAGVGGESLIKQMPPTEPALGQHKHARLLGVDGTCTGPAINS